MTNDVTDEPAPLIPGGPDGAAIRDAFLADERTMLVALAAQVTQDEEAVRAIAGEARAWVEAVRTERQSQGGIESFLQQYDLSTPEGVLLMCVAEALLRIPDAATADALIRDKLSRGRWDRHLGESDSLLVNASTWGLMLTGRLTRIEREDAPRSACMVRALCRARRRAGRARGHPAGDEADGRAIRARTHDRRSGRPQRRPPSRTRTGIRTTCSARPR